MPTFHHFVAVGVGAAIALSFTEPGVSQDLPSTQEQRLDQIESPEALPENAPAQKRSTESFQIQQEAGLPNNAGNKPLLTTTSPMVALSISPTNEQPEVEAIAKKATPDKLVIASDSAGGEDAAHITKRESDKLATESVNASTSKPIVTPTHDSANPTTAEASNFVPTPGNAVIPTTTTAPKSPQTVSYQVAIKGITPLLSCSPVPLIPCSPAPLLSQALTTERNSIPKQPGENTAKPSSPVGTVSLLQSQTQPPAIPQRQQTDSVVQPYVPPQINPAPAPPSLPARNPNAPAPEFLNPGPNPLLFPTQSPEVQVPNTQPISLQQAIELARRNNRQLQVTQLNLERSRYSLQEALGAEFPTAAVNLAFTRTESAQSRLNLEQVGNQLLGDSQNPVSTTFNAALQLSYDVYTSGRRGALIRAAEQQVRFQQLDVERQTQQLRLDVTNAYYTLQQNDAQVDINRAAVIDATQSLRDAVLQEQAGLGTRFDVLQAQVQLANAQQDLTTSLSQQRISRRDIVRLLSLAQTTEVSAADPIEVAGEWNLSLEQSIVLAYKNRAELEQYLLQRDIAEQQRIVELAANRPQVSLNANYNILGPLNRDVGPAQGLTLSANLQWQFFNGGITRARANQRRTDIAIAETNFATQRNQVRFEVEQAFFDLNSSAQNIQTASLALIQAQESLRLARLRFQAGVGTQLEVINQQTALTRARGNRLTAILNYNRALATLQRSVSNLPASNLFSLP